MSKQSTTSIVRGFSPSHISSYYRSVPLLNSLPSIPKSSLASNSYSPKKHTVAALGGSSQSGEDSHNETSPVESRIHESQQAKKKSFTFNSSSGEHNGSLGEDMPQGSLSGALRRPLENKKQTLFKEEVATRTVHEDRFMDNFETNEGDKTIESTIDDDNLSDWDDMSEESFKSSIDENTFFPRVNSRPELASRKSLITMMLHQNVSAGALVYTASKSSPGMHRSRTSSRQRQSLAASPDSSNSTLLMMKKGQKPSQEIPRYEAQPIMVTTTDMTPHQAALSPKTTRRNMLQTELTASLRRHLL